MNTRRLIALALILGLLAPTTAAAAPLAGPCIPGVAYDPACDANQDGTVNVLDIQLAAGHWNQSGSWVSDNNHDHLGQGWYGDGNALVIQGSFAVYPDAPLMLSNSAGNGLRIQSAGKAGVYVVSAADDGFWVCQAGNTPPCTSDFNSNGVDVASAEDYGVRVELAGRSSFRSDASGTNGVYIYDAGDSGIWVRAATNWAGYFAGNINVAGNCTGCRIAQFAVNSGPETLQAGDIVAMDGIADSPFAGIGMLLRVRRATPGSPLVGVVSGRAEPYTSQEDGSQTLVARDGQPAATGEYLSVVIYGPMQVRAAGHIDTGQRVTVGQAGAVRAMGRVTVDGVTLDEGGSSLGMALETAGDGLVWVLVNPQ